MFRTPTTPFAKDRALPDEFEGTKMKIIPLDHAHKIGTFGPGIVLPLKPFFGSMGIAPPDAMGKVNSAPPVFTPATWTTGNSSPEPNRMRTARCLRCAMVTRAWEMERWTSLPWRPR